MKQDWTSRARRSLNLAALACLVLGLVLLVWPDSTSIAICYCVGAILVVFGAFKLIGYFRGEDGGWMPALELVLGIAALVFGAFSLFQPQLILSIFPIALGCVVAAYGLAGIRRWLELRSAGYGRWWVPALLSLATLAVGLIAIFRPFGTLTLLVRILGVVLIYQGASELYAIYQLGCLARALERRIAEGEVVDVEDSDS